MISSRYRFIFLHIPKTGGNSVQSLLLPFSDDRPTATGYQDGKHRFGVVGPVTPRKHATLQEYADILGPELQGYKVAITLRAPFERMISLYFSPHRWQNNAPVWNEAAFLNMVQNEASASSFLRLMDHSAIPDFLLCFDTLEADLREMASRLGLPPALHALPKLNSSSMVSDTIRKIRSDPVLRRNVDSLFPDDIALLSRAMRKYCS